MLDAWRLHTIHALDRIRFRQLARRLGPRLQVQGSASPNLIRAQLRIEGGGRLQIGAGFATEREAGNHVWIQRDATVELGERVWLRTEHGKNRLTAFPGAVLSIGSDTLVNGAMLVAKREVRIGRDCRVGFGARVLDSDLHAVDRNTPERTAPVHIGDRVWIGANALILAGVTIGDDVVVGAGSVVTRDLPSRCLAVGQPAGPVREIGSREGCA